MSYTNETSINQKILIEQRLANEKPSKGIAYLLWFFVGSFGVHRFYLGETTTGAIMLGLWLLGVLSFFVIGFISLIPLGIWLVVDAFLIPGMVDERTDAIRQKIRQRIKRELAIGK